MNDDINKLLKGCVIHDCCILGDDYFSIMAEDIVNVSGDNIGEVQFCVHRFNNNPKKGWGWFLWHKNSWYLPKLINIDYKEALIVDDNGTVFYMGLGENKKLENTICISTLPGVSGIKMIDGKVYGVSVARSVAVRNKASDWEKISSETMWNNELSALSNGFADIDGFSKDDLYAVGGNADVWRYDGKDWIPLDVVSDMLPRTVCCAEDGFVYIGGVWGDVLRGRGDEWEYYIPKNANKDYGGASRGFTRSVSYQGRVYLSGESIGTYYIDHNSDNITPQPYDFNGEIEPFSARFMSVGYGKMMFANQYRIALYDGEKWIDLYGHKQQMELKELMANQILLQESRELLDGTIDLLNSIKKK